MIDLHCHIDLYKDPQAVLRRADAEGIYVLSVTTTPKAWCGTNNMGKKYKRVQTSLGLHPQLVAERYSELPLFERLLSEVKYVGEIGLDKSRDHRASFEKQLEIFIKILQMCTEREGRIMSIHSSYAVTEVLDALEAFPMAGPPILHWFTGSLQQLSRAKSIGCWFSVGPKMAQSNKGKSVIQNIPIHRLLLETDGPFTSDKNGRPFEPTDTLRFVRELSEILKISENELRKTIINNFGSLTEFNTK
jgi:TatD DNase family protein